RPALTAFGQGGFTLIELLIALTIFAVMAIISYRSLSAIFDTRERLQVESARLRDVALLFARLDNDLIALLDRPIRSADGLTEAAFALTSQTVSGNRASLSFTRAGFANTEGAADTPQRVGYRFNNGTLELMLWPSLDQAPRTEPGVYAAIRNLREARFRVLDRSGTWQTDWPPAGGVADIFPTAIELNLTLDNGDVINRLFVIRYAR
ncbi:MAG: type II secretion system minor pseudopilin GspJ, partial [Betaproteobacteria bacterium]|nr:type II secretion system minor pseudopilin GspJ [Betaproteobacteria bacterium]